MVSESDVGPFDGPKESSETEDVIELDPVVMPPEGPDRPIKSKGKPGGSREPLEIYSFVSFINGE